MYGQNCFAFFCVAQLYNPFEVTTVNEIIALILIVIQV